MELKEAIWTRRSVRKFKPDPIPHEIMEELIEGACMAPSATNAQPWYFVVLETPEGMARYEQFMQKTAKSYRSVLEARFPNHPHVVDSTISFLSKNGGAPVIVLAFIYKPNLDNETSLIESVSAAIQNLLLLAWEKGIGSCWLASPLSAGLAPEIEAEFAPDKGRLIGTILLGYPDESPKAPKRKSDRYEFL